MGQGINLKLYFLSSLVLAFCVIACKKEETVLPLQALGFDGKTALVLPSGILRIKFNQRVTWKTTAGTATQTAQDSLVYTAPSLVGSQRITVKSEGNLNDSLVIKVVVTPRADVLRPLQKGGYVLVFRHAAADVGSDQTSSTVANWWKSCDSKLARQLNDLGKKEAEATGKVLKNLEIPVGRVFSSEFCRCFTTADLMSLGVPNQQTKELTFYVYEEAKRYENMMKMVDSQPIDVSNTVLVGHTGFTGTLPSPAPLVDLNWGDAAVFQSVAGQPARFITKIKVSEWTELAP